MNKEEYNIGPIGNYLPQRKPFILVDEIVEADEKKCLTRFNVTADAMMVEDGYLTEGGLIENLAQTCAAHIGFVEIHIRKSTHIRIGLVGALKQCSIRQYPKLGEIITTEVCEEQVFGDMSSYTAIMRLGEEEIARGELQVVLNDMLSERE